VKVNKPDLSFHGFCGKKMKQFFVLAAGIFLCFSCVSAREPGVTNKPAWVDQPSAVYPDNLYVSAGGGGRNRTEAENNAKAALVSYFRQSVSSQISITDTERQENGRSSSGSDMSQSIEAASAMETLIGVEIKATWHDAKNKTWWAAAVMEKAQGRQRYADELDKTIRDINMLSDISGGVSFETLVKCKSARELLPRAELYALVLSMLDGPNRQPELTRLVSKVDDTLKQAESIPVDIRVAGDVDGRFKAVFAKAFTGLGFRTGSDNSRFVLELTVNLEPAPRNSYFNTLYTINAVLKDTQNKSELFTYNIADRESHPSSQAEANNRAVIVALRRIEGEFSGILKEHLGLP
jgi:hypothetical protein